MSTSVCEECDFQTRQQCQQRTRTMLEQATECLQQKRRPTEATDYGWVYAGPITPLELVPSKGNA